MEAELGKFELDESYFGARRVRGKRGRVTARKVPVFGILKRDGDVFVYHHYKVYHSHNFYKCSITNLKSGTSYQAGFRNKNST